MQAPRGFESHALRSLKLTEIVDSRVSEHYGDRMSEPQLPREVKRRLAIIRHVEEVTGNVALSCRYFGISRQAYYTWYRRY